MIYCLKGEIVYSHAPLEEAFERIGKREKGVLGELFTQTAEKIGCHNGETFSKIWEQTIEEMEKMENHCFWKKRTGKTPFFRGDSWAIWIPRCRRERYFCIWNSWNFLFQDSAERSGKMPAQYSLRGDGKPVFSDCNALGVERNYGCKSHFQDSSSGGILVSVICQVLKHSGRDEQAFLTSLAGLVMVLFWMIPYIYDLFETMKQLFFAVREEWL